MKDKTIKAFNKLSASYEHEVDTYNSYNIHYERPAMVDLLPKKLNGLKVLDAGCAAGWYTEYLLQKGSTPTAIDISPEMVEATKRRTRGRANVLCRDLSDNLPFEDDSFDIIISSLTLHYLENWHKTFLEFSRTLKTDGILLYSVHHPFMDISLSQTKEYFKTELLTDYWKKGEESIEVLFYRRPLQNILNITSQFFSLDSLIEPLPTEEFKEKNFESYERLLQKPNFLIIKAVNSKK
jgi:SAM-dependent methyltransferase